MEVASSPASGSVIKLVKGATTSMTIVMALVLQVGRSQWARAAACMCPALCCALHRAVFGGHVVADAWLHGCQPQDAPMAAMHVLNSSLLCTG